MGFRIGCSTRGSPACRRPCGRRCARTGTRSSGRRTWIRTPMSAEDVTRFARLAAPDVILCPFLKEVVPAAVCERTVTWIPHPGIRGDRGPSLAVLGDPRRRADVGADHGQGRAGEHARGGSTAATSAPGRSSPCRPRPPWARSTPSTSSRRRSRSVRARSWPGWPSTRHTAACPWPTSVVRPPASRPALRQDRLAFAWDDHPDQILRRVRAPFGVRTEAGGQPVNVYDAHPHDVTDARSRTLRTRADRRARSWPTATAPCWSRRAGAARSVSRPRQGQAGRRRPGLKLPAVHAVPAHLAGLSGVLHADRPLHHGRTHQVIRYRREGRVGWIHAEPYSGAASTAFCDRLLDALRYAASRTPPPSP